MRTSKWVGLCCFCGVVTWLIYGCDDESPSPNNGPECVEDAGASGCLEGQVCLVNHCYDQCQGDTDCARWERCSSGLCQASTMPQGDADIPTPDADSDTDTDVDGDVDSDGDTDADGDTDCSLCPNEQCHGVTGECVSCASSAVCLTLPVCDIGRGVCVDFATSQCAPCRTDSPGSCGDGLECVDRTVRVGESWEIVCMASCAAGCPRGTQCTVDGLYCEPIASVSCTGWYAAFRGRTCGSDSSDCLDLGSISTAVTCSSTDPPTCVMSCSNGDECPPGLTCTAGTCGY